MYNYEWDKKTRGYRLTTQATQFVASELRPVFAEELLYFNGDQYFSFNPNEENPLLWAKQNVYFYNGEECAKLVKNENGNFCLIKINTKVKKLIPVDIDSMVQKNKKIMDSLVADTLKRIKEMYEYPNTSENIFYISYSGGKDSSVLLDLCHKVLPLKVPVVFNDTDMELPDTYTIWETVKQQYSDRNFILTKAKSSALQNWSLFGPPSQQLRWCCYIHKSTPSILALRNLVKNEKAVTCAFLGIRQGESLRRSSYRDISFGEKSQSQINFMPILYWGTQELFLYIFENKINLNKAYRLGLPRVGCVLCPMAKDSQTYLLKKIYPELVMNFANSVKDSLSREFNSQSDMENFIFNGGWHARKSGVSLKDVILPPTQKKEKSGYSFSFGKCKKKTIYEWSKTLGKLENKKEFNNYTLKTKGDTFLFELGNSISQNTDNEYVTELKCTFDSDKYDKNFIKLIKNILHKASACVGCRYCEAECPTGALSFNEGEVAVNSNKCIHCHRCHVTDDGCWRYFSKRYAGGTSMNISGINKYMTFGLKQEWVEVLSREKENFRNTSVLGNRMIPSAVTWFREARLISNQTSIETTKTFMVSERYGFDNSNFWDMVWISICNSSPLIKWFVTNSNTEQYLSSESINEMLAQKVQSDSVKKGAIQSLFATLKNSPLGIGRHPVVELTQKGNRVLGLKRIPKSVDPLVILYSLYVMAEVSDRTSFTLSEMMSADSDSSFISPLIAFGMDVDELKNQCRGLATLYPSFISCSFTLGLEEVKIFPKEKCLDDVVDLILG